MQNNEDRTRRDGTGQNVSRGSGGRRRKRVKRQKEKMLRREISAILLGTLAAAFFILTEPGKNMISAVTGTSNVPEVGCGAGQRGYGAGQRGAVCRRALGGPLHTGYGAALFRECLCGYQR